MPISGKEMVRLYEKHGWVLRRIRGSHYIMFMTGKGVEIIPVHGNKSLDLGLEKKLLKKLGV